MNWTIDYIEPDDYVKITVEGMFSTEKHSDCLKKLVSSPFWKPGINLLYDNRNFDFDQMSMEKVRTGSENYQKVSGQLGAGKMALLMKSPLGYGVGRQFQMFAEHKLKRSIRVFTIEGEALRWLRKQTPDFH